MGSSSSKGPIITKHDRAVLDLKLQRDRLKRYQNKVRVARLTKLQYVLDKEYEIAREALASGQRSRAKLALQRRTYQRGLIEKTDQQLSTLQELVSTIEFAQMEQSIMYGLEQGNQVLKEIHKEMSLDRVDDLMSDTAEAQQYQQEIDSRLATQLTIEEQEDVEEQLKNLAAEIRPISDTDQADTVPVLPSAPAETPITERPSSIKLPKKEAQAEPAL
ncbi:Vacuolar protein sorting-associated protein 20 [Malassezia yamatoensis]|uniref:Vacuolar protein sorting-associated protein 20 n=1 Tax=Malassezia yamatoensis TaxID=253288 RepID=A0AAJ6CH80_9BASI|nr:Vacuolar protein sorting-associated protein 20 [Malassezia yamatoensis]